MDRKIQVYTDYKSLIYVKFNTCRLMHWRLTQEESVPEYIYFKNKYSDRNHKLTQHCQEEE